MRGIAYVVAAIAAVGIMIGIANLPQSQEADAPSAAPVAASAEVMQEAGTLTLSVPKMHCEFACFPQVKETLEQAEGVQEVELAAQKEEGVIDNRQVIVKYDPGFDLPAALSQLTAKGFDGSEQVQ